MQMVCATYVYCVQYGVNHKSDVCMLNKPPVLTYHSHQTCCTHTHTHIWQYTCHYFCPAVPRQVFGTLRSEIVGVIKHWHLLSPQSWICVFSCSVSQENRADLPSSSSYFRSLTKCCRNTDKLRAIGILIRRLYRRYRDQSVLILSPL